VSKFPFNLFFRSERPANGFIACSVNGSNPGSVKTVSPNEAPCARGYVGNAKLKDSIKTASGSIHFPNGSN